MTVNEKIKMLLSHGDKQRIADILKTSHQNVSRKIDAEKEIDSVDFINAVCRVTNKPFSYFKPVVGNSNNNKVEEESIPMYIASRENMPKEEREDATNMARDLAVDHWKQKYNELLKRYKLLEGALEDSRRLAEVLDINNKNLQEQVDKLKARNVHK